jgi:hypothetical protein
MRGRALGIGRRAAKDKIGHDGYLLGAPTNIRSVSKLLSG